jgi:Na+(H+)/acetate symporter ActP
MVGTAALPHILMRYYTTPSVNEARKSVFWSLFCIFLLYFTAPPLAVLVKYDIYTLIVGQNFAHLPGWIAAWNKFDPSLMSVADVNKDGILQLAEISLGGDIVVLATPKLAILPYVMMAASVFFPALVLGVFWKRANKWGTVAGMVFGLGTCLYYMAHTYPQFIQWFGTAKMTLWFGIEPISAGIFGIPTGFLALIVVSLLTPAPDRQTRQLVEHVRYPNLRGSEFSSLAQ